MLRLTSLQNKLLLGLSLSLFAASQTGCQIIAGLGGEEPLGGGGSTSTGGTGGSTSTGGGGTAGSGPCTPGDSQTCYSGPAGTDGTGECTHGTAMCGEDAMWGTCDGEVVPGVELCASPKDENCDGLDCVVWVKTFNGDVEGRAVAVDAQGNVFAAIEFSAGVDFGDGTPVVPVGGNDLAILEYDKYGKLINKRVFPGTGYQSAQDLVIAKDGTMALAGSSDSQIDFGFGKIEPGPFVVKLDTAMSPMWAKSATGDGFPYINEIAVDSNGNVFVAGSGTSVDWGTGLQAGPDSINFWIAKLASGNGAPQWVKITKYAGFQIADGIAVDPSDSLVITGTMNDKYLGLSGDGNIPSDVYNCCGANAPFLLRLDPDGNLSNGKTLAGFSGMLDADVNGIANDKLGVSTLVGSFSGPVDFQGGNFDAGMNRGIYVLHDQTSGFQQTATAFAQEGVYAYPSAVALDSEGSVVFHGNYGGTPLDFGGGALPPNHSKFVVKLDKDGKYLWARTYELGDGNFRDMAVGTLEDETVLIGTFYGSADLGTGIIDGSGMFLVKLGK